MTKATGRQPANLTLNGGALGSLTFSWLADRYQHAWHFSAVGATSLTLLESIESNASAMWPVSPPLQQIHQQAFDDGREVIFGVGMSGRGHWSASFTLVPEMRSWIVELACRSPLIPESLSSTYALLGQWQSVAKHAREQQVGVRVVRLEPIAPSTTGVCVYANQLRISPSQLPTAPPVNDPMGFSLALAELSTAQLSMCQLRGTVPRDRTNKTNRTDAIDFESESS